MRRRNKTINQEETNTLTEGMLLRTDLLEQRENRVYTLLLKGILVYLIVMGGMGCYLSALDVQCSMPVIHIVLLFASLFCSTLYYTKRWQDVGYLLLLAVMFFSGSGLRHYINSGFYAVANDMAEQASVFFDSNAMRSYGEQVGNRYLAITVAMCYVGCVCCILMNILISRRMRYFIVVPLCIGILLMPLYLELEPSLLYVAMLFGGLLSAYIIRGNGHYQLSFDNHCYRLQARQKSLTYVYAGKVLAGLLAAGFLFCFLAVQLLGVIYPQEKYQEVRQTSEIKEATKDTVENISMLGLMGLFNFYPNTGGLTNGTLGGISSVRYDYETDLTLTFAPYTQDRLYFKTFTGNEYLPFRNRWSRQTGENGENLGEQVDETTELMKQRYENGDRMSARGRILIKNEAAATGIYLPYFSEDVKKVIYPGETQEYTFYPAVSVKALDLSEESEELVREAWLELPEDNRSVIEEFCREAGLSRGTSIQETVQALAQYYQENIPYTIRPGATPYQKDFINYFLTQNKRGYCAHFASAAVLIFRYLGIPARYIEGYAIDPEDISEEGTMEYEEQYEDYYDGYSPLGSTAVVSVNATDANAHAWVEVYDPELGWQVADVTPASEEEETDNGFWQRLLNFLGGSGEDAAQDAADAEADQGAADLGGQAARTTGYAVSGILGIIFVLLVCGRCVKVVVTGLRYRRSGWNDRLVMRYQAYLHKIERREGELRQQVNYREQIQWLTEHGYWRTEKLSAGEAVDLMEQAGFSKKQLTEPEFLLVLSCFGKKNKISRCESRQKRGGYESKK